MVYSLVDYGWLLKCLLFDEIVWLCGVFVMCVVFVWVFV